MKKDIKKLHTKKGFTLVEIMVSVAIFTIVVAAGMSALTNMLHAYKVAQSEKKAADSLNYVLENMTREIRLGYNYFEGDEIGSIAFDSGNTSGQVNSGSTRVTDGPLIGFDSSNNRGYMIYYLENGVFLRRHFDPVSGTIKDEALTDITQVSIDEGRVTIMNTASDDLKQPLVWIQLMATNPGSLNRTRIIQTLVSQRGLDVQN